MVAVSFLYGFYTAARQPFEKLVFLPVYRVKHAVHRFLNEHSLVQLDLILSDLTQLTGEGPEHPLKKLVNGADRKGTVVGEYGGQGLAALRTHSLRAL